jgi:hypothetical protein
MHHPHRSMREQGLETSQQAKQGWNTHDLGVPEVLIQSSKFKMTHYQAPAVHADVQVVALNVAGGDQIIPRDAGDGTPRCADCKAVAALFAFICG